MSFYELDSNNIKYYVVPESLLRDYKLDTNRNRNNGLLFYKKSHSTANENMIYLKEEDYIMYSKMINKASSGSEISLNAITMAVESSFLLLEKEGFNMGSYAIMNILSEQFLKLSFNDKLKEQFKTVLASPRSKEFVMKAVLCKAIANKLRWKSDLLLKRLFIASFFSDIGEIIPNPAKIPHQELSVQYLESYGKISEDLKQAILHHHEYNDGTGFYKLKKNKIHPMARIIRVVDELINLIMKKDKAFLAKLNNMSVSKLDSQTVKALLMIVRQ